MTIPWMTSRNQYAVSAPFKGLQHEQGIKAAGYLLASVPTIVLYITMQKYFVKGMTEGALKL